MALRRISHNLRRSTRHLTAVPSTSTAAAPPSDSLPNLDDVRGLFSSIPTAKLIRSSLTLHMAAIEPMVDLGTWVMNSRLMETAIVRGLILGTIKGTFYDHFCAGSGMEEVGRTVMKLWDSGLKGMLDYGLEHAIYNESCDRNLEEFVQTVESAKSLPPSSVSFVVVKITAICPISLLKRVSDILRWGYKNPSFDSQFKINDTLPIFSESSPFYHTTVKPEPLTSEEEQDLESAHQRLRIISQKCVEANIPLLLDAEDTSIQPAIDYFTYSAAIMYNKGNTPIIFGTIQAYLKDAKERLILVKKAADKMGLPLGIKLVRGAYIASESKLASSLGVESPIHNTIEQTHDSYNDCASFLLEEISNGSGAVVLATHNVESGKLAAAKARDLGIGKENKRVQFAQLYGMADSLSFGLRNAGFQVSKYLPFGPIEQILPYLLRRAEENKGMLSSSTYDRKLIRKELQRRVKSTIL